MYRGNGIQQSTKLRNENNENILLEVVIMSVWLKGSGPSAVSHTKGKCPKDLRLVLMSKSKRQKTSHIPFGT